MLKILLFVNGCLVDGITDIEAGIAFGCKTAFLGPQKCDACKVFSDRNIQPDFWGRSLLEFTTQLLEKN